MRPRTKHAPGARTPGWRPFVLLLLACCTRDPGQALATLQLTLGVVERDFSAQQRTWQAAEVGAGFQLGDGLRTQAASSALLELAGGGQLSLEPDTSIRFSSTAPEARLLNMQLELGTVAVQADHDLVLMTPTGPARLAAGTRLVLSGSLAAMRYLVQVGRAVFPDNTTLVAGESLNMASSSATTLPEAQAVTPATIAAAVPAQPPANALQRTPEISAQITGRHASIRSPEGWTRLPEGAAQLSAGSELSLERDSSVVLEHLDQRAVLQGGRYVVAPSPGVLVSASAGSLSAGSTGRVLLQVPGGTIEVAPHGQASVELKSTQTRIEVQAREVSVETTAGAQRLGPHERATLLRGGELRVEGRSLDYADMELRAGESMVVHDPAPPTAVRFSFAELCPELGVLQLYEAGQARAYATGRAAVALALKPGQHHYELRCGEGKAAVAQGNLSVLRDAGTRRMVGPQPATTLQADGRDYTVLYQNRLPDITLLWRDAPPGQSARLIREFNGSSETVDVEAARHVFTSGSLAEGKHVLHFEGGGKLSRRTTVNVAFDNAAPKAAIDTPMAPAAASGAELKISGVALPGWDVSIEGQPAKRDVQGRFSLPVRWPEERRALAIRLVHRERGTHVYLRRRAP